jgi:hypothetical protein
MAIPPTYHKPPTIPVWATNTNMPILTTAQSIGALAGQVVKKKASDRVPFAQNKGSTPRINALLAEVLDKAAVQDNEFVIVSPDDVCEVFSKYSPIYGSKPKALPMALLQAVQPVPRTSTYNYFQLMRCGLVYVIPPVTGRARTRYQITHAALALLDMWGEKNERFARFVSAYVTPADRRVITSASVDLAMGAQPINVLKALAQEQVAFPKMIERERKKEEKRKAELARRNYLLAQAQYESMLDNNRVPLLGQRISVTTPALGQAVSNNQLSPQQARQAVTTNQTNTASVLGQFRRLFGK